MILKLIMIFFLYLILYHTIECYLGKTLEGLENSDVAYIPYEESGGTGEGDGGGGGAGYDAGRPIGAEGGRGGEFQARINPWKDAASIQILEKQNTALNNTITDTVNSVKVQLDALSSLVRVQEQEIDLLGSNLESLKTTFEENQDNLDKM